MENDPDVAADTHRPEVRISRSIESVKLHAGIDRIELKVKSGGLDRFLFVAGKPGEAVCECVGNAKFHSLLHPEYLHDFIAKVVDEFKATLAPASAPARQPSLGDLANAQLSGVAPVEVKLPEVINPLSEYEVRNAYAIVDKMYKDAVSLRGEARDAKLAEANGFMDRYKRQIQT